MQPAVLVVVWVAVASDKMRSTNHSNAAGKKERKSVCVCLCPSSCLSTHINTNVCLCAYLCIKLVANEKQAAKFPLNSLLCPLLAPFITLFAPRLSAASTHTCCWNMPMWQIPSSSSLFVCMCMCR